MLSSCNRGFAFQWFHLLTLLHNIILYKAYHLNMFKKLLIAIMLCVEVRIWGFALYCQSAIKYTRVQNSAIQYGKSV